MGGVRAAKSRPGVSKLSRTGSFSLIRATVRPLRMAAGGRGGGVDEVVGGEAVVPAGLEGEGRGRAGGLDRLGAGKHFFRRVRVTGRVGGGHWSQRLAEESGGVADEELGEGERARGLDF